MCGIAGHVASADAGRDPRDAKALVRAMADALHHRGPDASGVHQSGAATLGHTRLSIIDLSTDANQPMLSADRQVVLVFNGEIYNFRELAAGLREAGVQLRTRSDTEVLLELYRLHGPSFVSKLRGMFAFAIWDAPRRRLVLGRDRLGKKPLYYGRFGATTVFASEIKALLRHPAVRPRPRWEGIGEYLSLQYVPGPGTAFEGIERLPPGHCLVHEKGEVVLRRYWQARYTPKRVVTEDQ
ncbi:MAG TPA: asparagine synthetase B, partial [Polyangia bacterium]|nr:asparagine synthetase B [Polyangia bacterium]